MSFDLLAGDVPSHPFGYLQAVAGRARALLAARTPDEVRLAADIAGTVIEQHIDELREQAVAAVVSDGDPEWCEVADGAVRLIPERIYDIAVDDNPVAALKVRTDEGLDGDAMSGLLQHELFAALGLDLIGEALRLLACVPPPLMADVDRMLDEFYDSLPAHVVQINAGLPDDLAERINAVASDAATSSPAQCSVPSNVDTAAKRAMQAVEAVCIAEWVRTIQNQIAGLESRQKAKRRAQTKKAEVARHAANRLYKEMVLAEWEKAPRARSARAAGVHFSVWLKNTTGVERSPEVVMRWILAHAKERGIVWS
ncbi:hypothetical protein MASR2M16_14770 [Thauera terpenica]